MLSTKARACTLRCKCLYCVTFRMIASNFLITPSLNCNMPHFVVTPSYLEYLVYLYSFPLHREISNSVYIAVLA